MGGRVGDNVIIAHSHTVIVIGNRRVAIFHKVPDAHSLRLHIILFVTRAGSFFWMVV